MAMEHYQELRWWASVVFRISPLNALVDGKWGGGQGQGVASSGAKQ